MNNSSITPAIEGQSAVRNARSVDNTSGENWNDVLVGVGSSSALSFRYDLWSIRDVHRQTLASQDHFAVAPPQGASTYGGEAPKDGTLITDLSDGDMNMPQTHPDRVAGLDDDRDEAESVAEYAPSPVGGASLSAGVSKKGRAFNVEHAKKVQAQAQTRRRERDYQQRQETFGGDREKVRKQRVRSPRPQEDREQQV